MDKAIPIYAGLVSIVFLWFSRNRKYYRKAVDSYGRAFADRTFRTIRLCGYLMLMGAISFLIVTLY